jgi:hypothetical protein
VKLPVVCPCATLALAGAIVTFAGVELDRLTVTPPVGAACARVKVPESVDPIPTRALCTVIAIGGSVILNRLLVTGNRFPLVAFRE